MERVSKCYLLLEDGSVFPAKSFGAKAHIDKEIVIQTSNLESAAGTSCCKQIFLLIYPLLDNYEDVNTGKKDLPRRSVSRKICTTKLVVSEYCENPNQNCQTRSLSDWMEEEGIPGVDDIDTHGLIKIIREKGTIVGRIVHQLPENVSSLLFVFGSNIKNLVVNISTSAKVTYDPKSSIRIQIMDCNLKHNLAFPGVRAIQDKKLNNRSLRSDFENLCICKGSSSIRTRKYTPNEFVGHVPEVLELILMHCNIKTLSRAARVSRLWNSLANSEIWKRSPQIITLPSNSCVYNLFTTKPRVTLLFVENFTTREFALKNYQKYFPNQTIVLKREYVTMNKQSIYPVMSDIDCIGLLIPEYRDIKIRTVYTESVYSGNISLAGGGVMFLNYILPEDTQTKATFIFFGSLKHSKILNNLHKSMQERKQEYVLWGGDMSVNKLSDLESSDKPNYDSIFAMSIAGSSYDSAAIVISCEIEKPELLEKLQEFRKQIKFKRYSIGLINGRVSFYVRSHRGSHTKYQPAFSIHVVKTIFPEVALISGFDNQHSYCYGINSDDIDEKFEHNDGFCLLILTFD